VRLTNKEKKAGKERKKKQTNSSVGQTLSVPKRKEKEKKKEKKRNTERKTESLLCSSQAARA
jgi:hypothetical protein